MMLAEMISVSRVTDHRESVISASGLSFPGSGKTDN